MVKAKVKWGKQKYEVDVNVTEGVETLKAQLFALTGVPVDRQKLLVKGKVIKSDDDLSKFKEGQRVMMMGSAESLPAAPKEKIVFEEDLTDAQKGAVMASIVPPGLQNLGNTCYMNSTVQCLKSIKPLNEALQEYANKPASQVAAPSGRKDPVVSTLGALFHTMKHTGGYATPMAYTNAFRQAFPQFNQRGAHGYMQQDADEAFVELLRVMANALKKDGATQGNVVDDLFGVQLESTMVNVANPDEKPQVTTTWQRKLQCFIDIKVNLMYEGIKKGLEEELEKKDSDGNIAQYKRTSRVKRLPPFLAVHFVRFFFKRDDTGAGKKCKIMRRVKFPLMFDISDFCTEPLKKLFAEKRQRLLDEQNAKLGLKPLKMVGKGDAKDKASSSSSSSAAAAAAADDKPSPMDTSADDDAAGGGDDEEKKQPDVDIDPASADTMGMYELSAVVTHKGRTGDGGHYVGWARDEGSKWLMFDDDKVSECTEDDVLKLCGGGDWHMSYLCFYRRLSDEEQKARNDKSSAAAKKNSTEQ